VPGRFYTVKTKFTYNDVYINIRIHHYTLKTVSLAVMEVKTTLPGRSVQLKYHNFNFRQNRSVPGRCQFTFNEPTKRRMGAVEF